MAMKKKVIIAVLALALCINLGYSYGISMQELLSGYNFDLAEKINATAYDDFMIDRDGNGANDTLIFGLTLNNSLSAGNYILSITLIDSFSISNESNRTLASGINSMNISFDSSLLLKNKFNYSIKVYNSSYSLKYRKDGIETKEYGNYEAGYSILNVSDRKIDSSLSMNITINSTKDTTSEMLVYLRYNSSVLSSRQNATLSSGINNILVNFDNESIKRTHFKGRFNISSLKIGDKPIKLDKSTDYYDYEDFAASSYISEISDNLNNGNLAVNFRFHKFYPAPWGEWVIHSGS